MSHGKIKRLIEKSGEFLVDLLKLDQPGKGKLKLQQDLVSLSTGKRMAVRNYYIRKISIFLCILIAGGILTLTCSVLYMAERKETAMQSLGRPGYGESDRKEALTVQIEGEEEEQQLEVTIQARKYTDDEKQKMLEQALEELDQILPGENASLDEVRSSLVFPAEMQDGAVKVSWMTIPYGVIAEDGSITGSEDENGTLVEIQGTLTCGGQEAVYQTYAKVFPPELPEQERFRRSLEREVEEADLRDSYSEILNLPEEVEGKRLRWLKEQQNTVLSVLFLTLVIALFVYVEMDNRIHQKAEERKRQLLMDYPDLMWKMTMLLGAGLSIKGVFTRIAREYLREKEAGTRKEKQKGGHKDAPGNQGSGHKIRHVYEEVVYACYEMQSGVSEAQAYERFGKRCQLPEYIRLGSVLSQNLKKGSKGLTSLLETEAEASMNDRKNHARKIGEQAGTKLLLPMVLMLGIVLVILMVPAFLSF